MKKIIFILFSSAFVFANTISYKCVADSEDIMHIKLSGKKIYMSDNYGDFTGSLYKGEYLFGHGTGSIKIVKGSVETEHITIMRDDNVNEKYFSCQKIK